jgi:hypothetical protein
VALKNLFQRGRITSRSSGAGIKQYGHIRWRRLAFDRISRRLVTAAGSNESYHAADENSESASRKKTIETPHRLFPGQWIFTVAKNCNLKTFGHKERSVPPLELP